MTTSANWPLIPSTATVPSDIYTPSLPDAPPIFMTYEYARSEPGHPGISLHTDGQPYGSPIFGYECSCPVMGDRKSTRLNSSHRTISYAVFCVKQKNPPVDLASSRWRLAPPWTRW